MFSRIIFIFGVLPSAALADGLVSPFADSSAGVVVNFDGPNANCSKPASKTNVRLKLFKRQFTQISVDQCLWSPSVNLKALEVPSKFSRIGADVSCSLEETRLPIPVKLERDGFSNFLQGKGFSNVHLEATATAQIDGREFQQQQISANAPGQFDKSKPLLRYLVWIWADERRLVAFECVGPGDTALKDMRQIVDVSSTLKISN